MQCNVGKTERIIRSALGILILGVGVVLQSWWGLVGLLPLVTAVIGWCPISAALGVSTCKDKKSTFQDTSTYKTPRPMRTREMDKDKFD
ncbi:MAG: YgaP family membrane protein [Desulfovibrionales bacterium]